MEFNTIIVAANLGHLKVFRLVKTPTRGLKLELLEELSFPEAHGHFADRVTDASGRFPVSEGAGPSEPMAAAEALNAKLELHRRLTRLVAEQTAAILRRERPRYWDFAATSDIHNAILEEIPPELRHNLLYKVNADLTKLPPEEVAAHFIPASKAG